MTFLQLHMPGATSLQKPEHSFELSDSTPPHGRAVEVLPDQPGLPGLECAGCGQIWAMCGALIPGELPVDHPLRSKRQGAVPNAEFEALVADVRAVLGLPDSLPLYPGTEFGYRRLRGLCGDVSDFEWPGKSAIVVTQRVVDVLTEHGLTGWRTEPVDLVRSRTETPLPELFELVIDGRAGDVLLDPPLEVEYVCPQCGRVEFKPNAMDSPRVKPDSWDGSDFFRFSSAPCGGWTMVSERAAAVLAASGLTNFELTVM